MFAKSYRNAVETRAIINVLQALVFELAQTNLNRMSYREKEELFYRVEINASAVTLSADDDYEREFLNDVSIEASVQSRKLNEHLRDFLTKL